MNTETQALQVQAVDQPLSVADVHDQVQLIQQVLKAVMKRDTHYGVIPGTGDKPSLLKPGAEKIMATFRLAADPQVEDLSNDKCQRFRVTVRLISPSGRFVGAGVGECSTLEEKYHWRNAICEQEFEETPVTRRREKWKKGWGNRPPYKAQQVIVESADQANTVLKMAKKRALIDAVLTATAASDIFTQDLEDLPPELRPVEGNTAAAPAGVRAQEAPHDNDTAALVERLEEVAKGGWGKLQEAWAALPGDQRAKVGKAFGRLKALAENSGGSDQ